MSFLAGCATSSGQPTAHIAEPAIAAAYRPLHGRVHLGLDAQDGASVVIAPGIAVTNQHNENMVDPRLVIGAAAQSDLLFFHVQTVAAPPRAQPVIGEGVTAYGQGADADLRIAHGVVHDIAMQSGFAIARWFTFEGNAGPGFSGGPVVDAQGRLIGITFAYKDEGGKRLIYAYDMARVQAELDNLSTPVR
ncbi:MAG: trypsin-like peptidase domain-containing protein [Alphaproteobacteria bacterium]|nr:trypsin-like peptidase domain-containing protein [Alphaproteobacteria bacterium]